MTTVLLIGLAIVLALVIACVVSWAWSGDVVAWAWCVGGGLRIAAGWLFDVVAELISRATK